MAAKKSKKRTKKTRRHEFEVELDRPIERPPLSAVKIKTLVFDLSPDGGWRLSLEGQSGSEMVEASLSSDDVGAAGRRALREAFDVIAAALSKAGAWSRG